MPSVLLLVFSISLGIGLTFFVLLTRWGRESVALRPRRLSPAIRLPALPCTHLTHAPECWLAIRSRNILSVKSALELHNAKPCRLAEGLAGESNLFITPPVEGWILVFGAALPDPTDDADACFRFVTEISRKLGHVQMFRASRVLNHHAWIRARSGRVQRAYAWAGRTVWHQGPVTAAEKEVRVKCYDYFSSPERDYFSGEDPLAANVERVPQLAARWSLDPGRVDPGLFERERGIAGELLRKF